MNYTHSCNSGKRCCLAVPGWLIMERSEEMRDESVYQALFDGAPIAIWDEDFSSVKNYLDELIESGARNIREYLAANPEAVGECIRRVRVRHVNRVAREFYGAETEEHLIRSLPELFDEASLDAFREEISALAEGKGSFGAEILATTLKGQRRLVQMNVSILPTPDDDWSRVVVAFTDLTERRHLEQSLRRANEALHRINADLEQFAYAAAHDLREPLRTIALYAQFLQKLEVQAPGTPIEKALNYILDNAKRMETLVHDLLVFAQSIEASAIPQNVSTDARFALDEVLASISAAIAQAGARIHISPGLPVVAVQQGHLRQLFQNLIANAIKYRSPGRDPEVRVTSEEHDGEAIFCIADNGIGIKPDYHDQIFGVFKRLHGPQIQGNGIGLALCKRIVQQYGGRIWVESDVDAGARFYFTLPPAPHDGDAFAQS